MRLPPGSLTHSLNRIKGLYGSDCFYPPAYTARTPSKVGAIDYRLIPGATDFGDLVVSHISANVDRSAYQEDPNIWFPLDRLREMAVDGEIGGVSSWHYSLCKRAA